MSSLFIFVNLVNDIQTPPFCTAEWSPLHRHGLHVGVDSWRLTLRCVKALYFFPPRHCRCGEKQQEGLAPSLALDVVLVYESC